MYLDDDMEAKNTWKKNNTFACKWIVNQLHEIERTLPVLIMLSNRAQNPIIPSSIFPSMKIIIVGLGYFLLIGANSTFVV